MEEENFQYKTLQRLVEVETLTGFYRAYAAGGFWYLNVGMLPRGFLESERSALHGAEISEARTNVIHQGEDYVCYTRGDDVGEEYKVFGLTRKDAYELILNWVIKDKEVSALLKPAIKKAFSSIKFFEYLKNNEEQKYSDLVSRMSFHEFKRLTYQEENDIKIVEAYIFYETLGRSVEQILPHPAVLKALTHVLGIELQIWRLDELGDLVLVAESKKEKNNETTNEEKKSEEEGNKNDEEKEKNKQRKDVKQKVNLIFLKGQGFIENTFAQIEFLNVCWKIHISLAEDEENIEKAWDEIVDLFPLYGIRCCKVLAAKNRLPAYQWGKEITMYCSHEAISLQELLDEITRRFIASGIQPNYLAFKDRVVVGSSFFTIRNDEGHTGRYVSSFDAINFNPSGKSVPLMFEKLVMLPALQPLCRIRENETQLVAFYQKLSSKIKEVARKLMEKIISCRPDFKDVSPDYKIWMANEIALTRFFSKFDSETRGAIRQEVDKIKEVHSLEYVDVSHCSLEELKQIEKDYSQRFETVVNVLEKLGELILDEALRKFGEGTPPKHESPRSEEEGEKKTL